MQILHLVHQYPPEHIGGTELYTQTLTQRLAANGHQATVMHPSSVVDGIVRETVDGVNVVRGGVGKPSRVGVFLSSFRPNPILDELKTNIHNYDLVHIQHLMGLPLGVIERIQSQRVPYVVTLHDFWFPCANAQLITNYDQSICAGPDAQWHNCGRCGVARAGLGNAPLAHVVAPLMRYRAKQLGPVLQGAAAIIAPTNFVRDVYAQTGFDTNKAVVIPHGIDAPQAKIKLAQQHAIDNPHTDFHVVFVGGVAWQKGIHVLIEAFNQLPHAGFRLTLAGDIAAFPDYMAELRALTRHPQVKFVGRVDRDELWRLLVSADVGVVPSIWYESFGLVMDEMWAAGLPVVASNLGAMAEKVRHGVDGLVFRPNDPIDLANTLRELAANPAKMTQLRQNIHPVRTIEQHVANVEQVYSQVLVA